MKNSHVTSAPRFFCQLVRTCRAVNENVGSGHVAGCTDCQAFDRAATELEGALVREAIAQRRGAPMPPDLARRIQQAIRDERAMQADRSAWTFSSVQRWAPFAVATAAAAVALAVYLQRPSTSRDSASSQDAQAVIAAVENFSVKLKDTVIPGTAEIVSNNPLQQEIGSVYSDARAALQFLALNFLPGTTAPAEAPGRI